MIEHLYQAFYQELLAWCRNMTGKEALAEDLVQEGYLRAMNNEPVLANLNQRQQRAWLYRTIRNLYVDYVRHGAFETAAETLPETAQESIQKSTVLRCWICCRMKNVLSLSCGIWKVTLPLKSETYFNYQAVPCVPVLHQRESAFGKSGANLCERKKKNMKKNLVINTEICDARNIKEENYAGYEQIILNAEILVVDNKSKEVLHKLPVTTNVEITLDLEKDACLSMINGEYEITGNTVPEEHSVLFVNGTLRIGKDAQEVLKQYQCIQVNGSVRCPRSLASCLGNIQVNGNTMVIPDDCTELKDDFEMDTYFPLRAKEHGNYFAARRVKVLDEKINLETLKDKHIHFVTKTLLTREEMIPDVIGMVDENTELQVVPAGYSYVSKDAVLDEMLLEKHGTKLYIDGSLTLEKSSTPWIEKLENLQVSGVVTLLRSQVEAFRAIGAEYKELEIVKGKIVKNHSSLTVDAAMLEQAEDGVTVKNCASLKVKEDVSPEAILERLQIANCATIKCSPQQKSALQMVSKNVANIEDGEDSGEKTGVFSVLKQLADSKIVNAEKYLM